MTKEAKKIAEFCSKIKRINVFNFTQLDDKLIKRIESFEKNIYANVEMQRRKILYRIEATRDDRKYSHAFCSFSFLNSDAAKYGIYNFATTYISKASFFVRELAVLQEILSRCRHNKKDVLNDFFYLFNGIDESGTTRQILKDIFDVIRRLPADQRDWAIGKIPKFIDFLLDCEAFEVFLKPMVDELNTVTSSDYFKKGKGWCDESHVEKKLIRKELNKFEDKTYELLDAAHVKWFRKIRAEAEKQIEDIQKGPQATIVKSRTTLPITQVITNLVGRSTLRPTKHFASLPVEQVSKTQLINLTQVHARWALSTESLSSNGSRNLRLQDEAFSSSEDSRINVTLLGFLLPLTVAIAVIGLLVWFYQKSTSRTCFFKKVGSDGGEFNRNSYITYSKKGDDITEEVRQSETVRAVTSL
jgi:hypothetical protein